MSATSTTSTVNWKYHLQYYNVPPREATLLENGLYLKNLDFVLHRQEDKFMLEGLGHALKLRQEADAVFFRKDQAVYVRIGALRAAVQTAEDLFILDEIYVRYAYGFVFQAPSVVIDVGFNVGFASLFFAQQPNVHAVYGYEPFAPTFRQGLTNMALNPFAGKVSAYNYGLSGADAEVAVDYSYEVKGQTSVTGTAARYTHLAYSSHQVALKDASGVLASVVAENPGKVLVAKIDCEGSEYAILKRWHDAGQLKLFKLLMIEWHAGLGPKLMSLLKKNQFQLFSFRNGMQTGFIYALR